jgi:hypothetical protein
LRPQGFRFTLGLFRFDESSQDSGWVRWDQAVLDRRTEHGAERRNGQPDCVLGKIPRTKLSDEFLDLAALNGVQSQCAEARIHV